MNVFNGLEPHLQHEAHLPLGALGELLPIEAGPSLHGQGAACAQHTLSIWQDTALHASGNSHVHPKALLRRSLQATMLKTALKTERWTKKAEGLHRTGNTVHEHYTQFAKTKG